LGAFSDFLAGRTGLAALPAFAFFADFFGTD